MTLSIVDGLLLTEMWITQTIKSDTMIKDLVPPGYSVIMKAEPKNLRSEVVESPLSRAVFSYILSPGKNKPKSFEVSPLKLSNGSITFNIIWIYSPPGAGWNGAGK